MKRSVSVPDARRLLDDLLEGGSIGGDEVVIERAGKPVAVVISAARYEAMDTSRERLFAMIDEVHKRNADVPLEIIEAEVAEAIADVRRTGF